MMPVLVPLKSVALAKGRLAPVLEPLQRQQLARAMAGDLLALLCAQPGIGPVIVCGSDDSAQHVAWSAGVRFLSESQLAASGLNPVIDAAAALLTKEGHDALMVVHGDLPLLTGGELQTFLRMHAAGGERAVTIGPDRWRKGTNLLAWRGLKAFRAQYGPASFKRHCDAARDAEARLALCELPGAAVDVDDSADLDLVRAAVGGASAPRTQAVLRELARTRAQSFPASHMPGNMARTNTTVST